MKRNIILFYLLFSALYMFGSKDNPRYINKQISKILMDLDSIIVNNKKQNDILLEHYLFVKNKIKSEELKLIYNPKLKNKITGCTAFNFDERNANISFGQFIIRKYKKYPALVYGLLIHSFQNAYDYYNKKEHFILSIDNPIEKTYFEIDALKLESIFLAYNMVGHKKLGYLEKYLMSDVNNNLSSVIKLLKKTDIELLNRMDELKNKDKSAEELLKEFRDIGDEIMTKHDFSSDDDWKNFCDLVTLKTYVYYSSQVIYDIVHKKAKVKPEEYRLKNYEENLKVITKVRNIVKKKRSYFSYYKKKMRKIEKYYL